LLAERRRAGLWDEPLGLLSHHLDHDEDAWRFLEVFLSIVTPIGRLERPRFLNAS
jgi:hypothetical protein